MRSSGRWTARSTRPSDGRVSRGYPRALRAGRALVLDADSLQGARVEPQSLEGSWERSEWRHSMADDPVVGDPAPAITMGTLRSCRPTPPYSAIFSVPLCRPRRAERSRRRLRGRASACGT